MKVTVNWWWWTTTRVTVFHSPNSHNNKRSHRFSNWSRLVWVFVNALWWLLQWQYEWCVCVCEKGSWRWLLRVKCQKDEQELSSRATPERCSCTPLHRRQAGTTRCTKQTHTGVTWWCEKNKAGSGFFSNISVYWSLHLSRNITWTSLNHRRCRYMLSSQEQVLLFPLKIKNTTDKLLFRINKEAPTRVCFLLVLHKSERHNLLLTHEDHAWFHVLTLLRLSKVWQLNWTKQLRSTTGSSLQTPARITRQVAQESWTLN